MTESLYSAFLGILQEELVTALGCTEPIAVAYTAAKAGKLLGAEVEHMVVSCSGNIIKNLMGVVVPNSGGRRGVAVAALLGILSKNTKSELLVLEQITPEHIRKMEELIEKKICVCELAEGVENLYIKVQVSGHGHTAAAEVRNRHTNIVCLERDGKRIYAGAEEQEKESRMPQDPREFLTVKRILEFAETVSLEEIRELLQLQIDYNMAISEEGLYNAYGACVGRTLMENKTADDYITEAKSRAAAGSDARMDGCSLPVVINSGSGNQGITVCVPVVCYAKYAGISQERLYRGLVFSNLLAIHQKHYIGRLSAYCGAVSAACGSGAAITYLSGGSYEQICMTITNTIAAIGGMVCDGAKSSCAAKIAAAVEAALLANRMSMKGHAFQPGEGLVKEDIEKTIQSVGRMGREGMRATDIEILNIMLEN